MEFEKVRWGSKRFDNYQTSRHATPRHATPRHATWKGSKKGARA